MLRRCSIFAALALIACDSGVPGVDAGTEDGGPSSQAAAPMAAAGAWTAECPAGWQRALGDHGCVPWGPTEACPAGEIRFVGDAACAPIGGACPAGEYAEGLTGDVRYVSASGRVGAAGTEADPFGSIAEALAGVASGATIAVGRGTFEETFFEIPAGVSVVGACAPETRVVTSHTERGRALVAARAGAVGLRGLTLRGSLFGLVATGGATVTLEGVVIDATTGLGVLATGGATVDGHDVVVTGVLGGTDGSGAGLAANDGAITLSRVHVSGVVASNVYTTGAGSRVSLSDAHLAGALVGPRGAGFAVQVDGGTVTLERALLEGGEQVGAIVGFDGSRLELRDAVIRDVPSSAAGGAGVLVGEGAALDAERVYIAGVTGSGVQVQDSSARLVDAVVHDCTSSSSSGGVLVLRGSEATVERALITDVDRTGFGVGRMATATVSDLTVEGTAGQPDMPYGVGVMVVDGSSLSLERAALRRNGGGVLLGTNATAALTDLRVEDDTASDDALLVGTGLVVADGSEATLTRAHVARALANGVVVEGAGSRLTAEDLVVEDTLERACPTDCAGNTHGSSVVAYAGGYASLTRFAIVGSALAGLRLLDGEMDLAEGEVRGHPIGIDIQVGGFDPSRISTGVLYLDNQRNVAMSEMPPPDVTVPSL